MVKIQKVQVSKIRLVAVIEDNGATCIALSLKGRAKTYHNPTRRLWVGGMCRIEGDSAYPVIPAGKPDVLIVKDS